MVKKLLLFFAIIGSMSQIAWVEIDKHNYPTTDSEFEDYSKNLYKDIDNKSIDYKVFTHALKGYVKLATNKQLENHDYLTIIDMTASSKNKRFFLINIKEKKVEYESVVAHGKNSGLEFAKSFSNKINSYQSSIGFYKTAETYHGKHGLSLRLDGLEFTNSNARKRAIVIHSADYASEHFVKNYGRLGRSLGCPSLPKINYKEIVHKIKNGSALFIYFPNSTYLNKSKLVNGSLANSHSNAKKNIETT